MLRKYLDTPARVVYNLLLAMVVYMVCRVAFLLDNWELFAVTFSWGEFARICFGGLWFDCSAVCYTNVLYVVLALLPFHAVAGQRANAFDRLTRWVYIVPNALCVALNLGDAVYYPYGHKRITSRIFNEFGNEGNLGSIFGVEVVHHWYFVLLAAVLVWGLWRLFAPSHFAPAERGWRRWVYVVVQLGVMVVPCIWGMRGATFFTSTRPLAVSNAHQFAARPSDTALVLNTPFSLIRTIDKRPPRVPHYYDAATLDAIYTPLHKAAPDSAVQRRKNVVILIVESFATEFIGGLNNNQALDSGTYKGYTPWIDSLIPQAMTYELTLANTGVSIDAMPAILASIPRMDYGFLVSPYSLNHITSLATELGGNWGYHSAFFHGGDNESMGFQGFARGAGFKEYYGMDEYCRDDRFGGMDDFDGTWAIWDEEFLQYYALKMSEMPQPFVTGVFTATSHHPFAIPDRYKDRFKDEGLHKLHKCIRYTDYSIGRFFETASRQPWYDNTIFVITADHSSSKTTHDVYKTECGVDRVPILIFDPSGEMPRGTMPGMMQQLDILPTLLSWMGYDHDYIAFGNDVLTTPVEDRWSFNFIHVPQLYMGDYFMQADHDCNVTGLYNYVDDILMTTDLKGKRPEAEERMQRLLKAFMQSYMERMEADSVRVRPAIPVKQ